MCAISALIMSIFREMTMKGYGPIDAMEYPRFSGIRTFMRLPQVQDLAGVRFCHEGEDRFGEEVCKFASVQVVVEMLNKSKGNYACTIIDVSDKPTAAIVKTLEAIQGVVKVRVITAS